jgi:hypothetical protein
MIKRFFSRIQRKKAGQSFVELALVVLILALMLSGVVEFGFLLNQYLKISDSTREAARYANYGVPFEWITTPTPHYEDRADFYQNTVIEALNVMSPILLNGNRGDNVRISVFTVGVPPSPTIVRWPMGQSFGWNLCDHYSDANIAPHLNPPDWSSCLSFLTATRSKFTDAQVLSKMNSSAPGSGVVLVEVFYNYPQLLKLPVFEQVLPDPMLVYAFSFMPLSSAAPTPGP